MLGVRRRTAVSKNKDTASPFEPFGYLESNFDNHIDFQGVPA